MVKIKVKGRKKIPQKRVFMPDKETTSSPAFHPNATTPYVSLESAASGQWLSRDSTNAPEIGEASEEQEQYAQSYPALIEKYVFSKHFIPFLLALMVIGFIFIQDNAAGKLTSWNELWWTIQKSGILLGIFLCILFCQFLYKKMIGKRM